MEFGVDILGIRFLIGDLSLIRPYEAHYEFATVVLSYLCAFAGCYASLVIAQNISVARRFMNKACWLAVGSLTIGAAVWLMHFTGMQAYHLPFDVAYDVRLTVLSALPAILAGGVVLAILSSKMVNIYRQLTGAVVIGAGIGLMHFSGMAAMRANASMGYNPWLFGVSILVAVVLAYTALAAKSRVEKLNIRFNLKRSNMIAAAIMGFAISGMHYTAMTAVTFYEGSLCATLSGPVVTTDFLSHIDFWFVVAIGVLIFAGIYMRSNSAKSALLGSIIENSVDALVVTNRRGMITLFSPSAERIFGYKFAEVNGKDVSILLPDHMRRRHKEQVRNYDSVNDFDIIGQNREVTAVRKSGEEFPVEVAIAEISVGPKSLFSAMIRDITTRKNTQQMQQDAFLEIANSLKRQKELNETQRQFVAMASHEFRTPLSVIDLTAQRLVRRKDALDAVDLVQPVEKIRNSVKHMTELMESMLTAARMESGKIDIELGDCSVGDLLQEACARHAELTEQHEISCSVTELPDTIRADASALRQIMTNLLSNAVKYSPEGGKVEVTARCDGADVIIWVRDSGLGIPADELPRMFTRFFRATTSTGISGTGIGLNLVQALVELHGGSISVESALGEGATFTVRLPVAGPGEAAEDASQPVEAA